MQRINHITFSLNTIFYVLLCIPAFGSGYILHRAHYHSQLGSWVPYDPATAQLNIALTYLHYGQYNKQSTQKQKYYEQAMVYCKKSLSLNPEYPQAHCYLGIALRALGHNNQAINAFNKAIELDGKYGQAYMYLAATLVNEKQFDSAISIYQQILNQQPNNQGVQQLLTSAQQARTAYRAHA